MCIIYIYIYIYDCNDDRSNEDRLRPGAVVLRGAPAGPAVQGL